MKIITGISRILVGVLFIISGLIKANDALGFSYKLDEYFTVFGTPWFINFSVIIAMLICILEVGLGVATLMGYSMVLVSWLLLLLIVFFTFLTGYSAYFDVVKDCGCFGDALKLTPWQSFGKDVALLFFILIIFSQRKKIKELISVKVSAAATIVGLFLTTWFTYHCYAHLPVKDFRPYAIGNSILDGMKLPEGAITDSVVMIFIYEKDGIKKEYSVDQLSAIDSTYTFVDRIDKVVREGDKPKIHDFSIRDAADTDYTTDFLSRPDYVLMLIAYDLNSADVAVQPKVNDLVAKCQAKDIEFFGITATVPAETEKFRTDNKNTFPFYYCDGTALKTIIRSNPGLVLLKNGTVINMWHHNDFPSYDELNSAYFKK
jgi:uncharacterized membrane protein YphA (DoxX/SURF4 family)